MNTAGSADTRLAGVMGWPVSHSLSPRLHRFWLDLYDIDGAYMPLPVSPENLVDGLRALPKLGFAGVNLTVPHKVPAVAVVDSLSSVAQRIGAVNTVVVARDGGLRGDNTDGFGFIENLKAGAPQWSGAAGPVAVIGAGGAARAIVVALIDAGVGEIRIVNRSSRRAEALAGDLGGPLSVCSWDERNCSLDGVALLVNATTLGMTGQLALDLDFASLPPGAVVNDIVYTPLETPLLADARRRGHVTVDGLGMLLHQARPGFAAWFGPEPEVTAALRKHVLAGL